MTEKTAQKEPGKKPVPSKKSKPQQEVVVQIPLSELHPFPDHPFQVREDASMQETAESVKEYGVLVPALARPREDGGYELIAGHRRKHACELAGLATMPVIVRDIDRDAATIIMVDSNLQRENILPSERAQAYKMKLEAIRRKAGRPAKTKEKADENNSPQVGAVDKVSLCSALPTKKDALWRHPACFIILFRFNAVADKRQWSSAASKPRRKTRAKLCSRFCAENEPSHQTCRSFSASR